MNADITTCYVKTSEYGMSIFIILVGAMNVSTGTYQKIYFSGSIPGKKGVRNKIFCISAFQFFNHPEGYVKPVFASGSAAISSWEYIYQYKDHLGNVRVSYADTNNDGTIDATTEIIEESNYYPFGLRHRGYNNVVSANGNSTAEKFKYQGQELEEELGKNTYAYQWRDYDPAIGRFSKIDRFAEKYMPISPYSFTANNPIRFIDIKGDSIFINYKKEKILYENGKLYSRGKNGKYSEYNGKGLKVKKDGTKVLKGFLGKAVAALNKIRTGGKAGSKLVGDLQSSNKYIQIEKGSNSAVGYKVKWNPSDTSGGPNSRGNTNRPAYIGLAHELGHAHDALDGKIDNSTWFTLSDGTNIPVAEQYGSHWENRIRSENGIPLRTHYSIDNGTNVGQLIGSGNRSLHFNTKLVRPTIQVNNQWSSAKGTFKVIIVPGSVTTTIPFKYK